MALTGAEEARRICRSCSLRSLAVIVEHPVYGQIIGSLDISSRYDVSVFMEKISSEQAQPLSALTGGIHLHTLSCDGKETYDRTCEELKRAGLLFDENS